jgi:glycosyltransferase involved in cell wall biosynthesis
VRRAEVVAHTASNLKQLGFEPDIIVGHHGWGELLNIRDVWPDVPLLGYLEFYYCTNGIDVGFDPEFPTHPGDFPRIRAKNAVNLLALNLGGHAQTPTRWQLSTYPDWARERITLLPEGVNLDVTKPSSLVRRRNLVIAGATIKPSDKLVTYVSRDLEPYRGFHQMMRAVPHLLRARKDVRVVLVGADGISYGASPVDGTWREKMLAELGDSIDPSRVVFPGRVAYETYVALLQRSDSHVYLTYPFVASWSLREALATGCVVIGSDTPTVREFITHNLNGLLVSFFDPKELAKTILQVLEDAPLARRLRDNARRYAEKYLAMDDYIAAYEALISSITGR